MRLALFLDNRGIAAPRPWLQAQAARDLAYVGAMTPFKGSNRSRCQLRRQPWPLSPFHCRARIRATCPFTGWVARLNELRKGASHGPGTIKILRKNRLRRRVSPLRADRAPLRLDFSV
jgi:hypothetical protein